MRGAGWIRPADHRRHRLPRVAGGRRPARHRAAADSIGRADLDGANAQPQFITGAGSACGVAVDAAHVYWGDGLGNRIGRANLDGTGADHDFITDAPGACGVAVNGTHVFWANNHAASVGRASLDGTGANQSFIVGATGACSVAIDDTHIYWSADHLAIGRANLDGSGATQNFLPGRVGCGVAVDQLTTASMTVTPSPTQIVFGQDITFDAAVTGPGDVPTGTVQFFINDEPDGAPIALDAGGHVLYSPEFLLGVGDLVSAAYSGDAVHGAVRVLGASSIVHPAPTSTNLMIQPGTVVTGDPVSVTVTVSNTSTGVTPFGSVQFEIDGELLGPPLELDDNGQAAVGLIADVPPADYLVTARYADDIPPIPYFLPSAESKVVRVTAAPPPGGPETSRQSPPASPPHAAATVVSKRSLTALGRSRIAALRKHGFAALSRALSYTAPGPGTLTQSIYAEGPAANTSASRAKGTLISSGRRVFTAAGKGVLRPRLTAAGRRMIKRANRLKLRVVTRFAPLTGSPVRASQRATIQRRARRSSATAGSSADEWRLAIGRR